MSDRIKVDDKRREKGGLARPKSTLEVFLAAVIVIVGVEVRLLAAFQTRVAKQHAHHEHKQ